MDPSVYRENALIEDEHWWFVGRRRIIDAAIQRFLSEAAPPSFQVLEVGCGSGGNSPTFARFGQLLAVEPEPMAAEIAQKRGGVEVVIDSLPDLAVIGDGRFDLILLCDVLEHVDREQESIRRLTQLLRPGGILVVTVPAFQFLWGYHDELHHHRRRYRRPDLVRKISAEGLRVEYAGYFNSILFLPAAAVRLLDRWSSRRGKTGLQIPANPVNRIMTWLFALERHWVGRLAVPFGLSLLAVARRVDR